MLPSPARLNIKTQPAYFAGCLDAMHDPTGYEKGAASDEMERLLDWANGIAVVLLELHV